MFPGQNRIKLEISNKEIFGKILKYWGNKQHMFK